MTTTTPEAAEPCEICADGGTECCSCDATGEDGYRECYACGGTGLAVPEHCCECGGSPYCVRCHTCGAGCVGSCSCPVTVQLLDGTTRTL